MKTEPKMCPCRICGYRYQSKSEAKACMRNHVKANGNRRDLVPKFVRLYK